MKVVSRLQTYYNVFAVFTYYKIFAMFTYYYLFLDPMVRAQDRDEDIRTDDNGSVQIDDPDIHASGK